MKKRFIIILFVFFGILNFSNAQFDPIYFHNINGTPGWNYQCSYQVVGHIAFFNGSTWWSAQQVVINSIAPGETKSITFSEPDEEYVGYTIHFHLQTNNYWAGGSYDYEFPWNVYNGWSVMASYHCGGYGGGSNWTYYYRESATHFDIGSTISVEGDDSK